MKSSIPEGVPPSSGTATPAAGPALPELAALARAELRRRWLRGDRVRVEDLLRECPALGDNREAVLDLIYVEFVVREDLGEKPTPQEYLDRFAEHAAALAVQFELHAAIAGGSLGLSALDPAEHAGQDTASLGAGGQPASSSPPPIPGYEILELLGKGGMGVVYKARQTALGRLVALKMILQASHAGPADRLRFHNEAEAVARLQHPNIVQVHEVGDHEGVPYFSLEFCAGGSLDRRLRGTPLPARQAAALVEKLARAAHAAHRANMVHRDLKPANILLVEGLDVPLERCTPKITDFGLAKRLDATGPTRPGVVVGSPSYMAPEQARGNTGPVGPSADVYALGAILYELLTGRPPFTADTLEGTLYRVVHDEPTPLRRLQPRIPRDLETVCLECLHKDPRKRYPSAEALAEDLRRFGAGEPVMARPAGPVRRLVKWARRRPAAATLAAVTALLSLGILVGGPLLIARLQDVAAQARADADRERTLRDRESARADGEKWLAEGQAALTHRAVGPRDLRRARALFTRARDRVVEAGAPEDAQLSALRTAAERHLEALSRRMRVRGDFQEVLRQRDQALFLLYGETLTGTELGGASPSREAARAALDRFGWPDKMLAAVEGAPLDEEDRKALRVGLYELCLVLAEAVARAGPGHATQDQGRAATEALEVLAAAAPLFPDGRTLARRQARYLALKGNAAGAARARSRADAAGSRTALDWFFEGLDFAFDEGKLPEARTCLAEALRLEPDLFWAHFFGGLISHKLHDTPQARASLSVCVYLRPDFPWTYLVRGSLAGQGDDFAAAAADFAQAEKLLAPEDRPGHYVLFVNRGFVALRKHDPARAAADLEAAVQLCPELYPAYVNLAEALALQKDYAGAIGRLDRAVELARRGHDEAASRPGRPTMNAPAARLASLYSTRARMHLKRQDDAAALHDLDLAIRWAPSASPAQARDHHERALVLYRQGRYPQAVLACRAALAIHSDDPATHRLLGEAQLQLGCWEEALEALDRCLALQKSHDDAEFFRKRARARSGLRDPRAAAMEYSRALLHADDAPTYAARGWAYLDAEAPRLALADFNDALRRDATLADVYNGRGLARIRLGDHFGAAEAEKALQHAPDSWPIRAGAARVYARAAALLEATGPAGSREFRLHYEERGGACLREAFELHPQSGRLAWVEQVLHDPAFVPLRRTAAFSRLRAFLLSP
jgi:tetratricopeptide (TPR) repeat protein